MTREEAEAFAGTRLAQHTARAFHKEKDGLYYKNVARLNREAAEALGQRALFAYEELLRLQRVEV